GGIHSTQELSSFFSPLGAVGQMSDPQASYDELTNRFVVGALDFQLPGIGPSRFDFAVSDTSDPTAGWAFRRYDMNDLLEGVADVLSSSPSFTAFPVAVAPYLNPFPALRPGGLFNTNDSRILNAAWRGNRLVASQTVAGLFTAQARWYDLNVGGVPTLTQSGR